MKPNEITEALLAMTDEELTEKVAELLGWKKRAGAEGLGQCWWAADGADTPLGKMLPEEHRREEVAAWSPSTNLIDAWELLVDMVEGEGWDSVKLDYHKTDGLWSVVFYCPYGPCCRHANKKDNWHAAGATRESAPRAIASAWAWWKWCERCSA